MNFLEIMGVIFLCCIAATFITLFAISSWDEGDDEYRDRH
jgi:hypothetical protein